MILEIIAGITATGVFIGFIFFPKPSNRREIYPEIGITEYCEFQELRWYDSSDSEE